MMKELIFYRLQKFLSHAFVECVPNNVSVKTERDVEQCLGIPTELRMSSDNQAEQNRDWNTERAEFTQRIVDLKAENQQTISTLEKSQADYAALLVEKQKLLEDHSTEKARLSKQMDELRTLNSQNQSKSEAKKQEDTKTISDLMCQNKRLQAQIKQFRSGIMQQNSKVDDKYYEVEAITDHQGTRNARRYLVHWKDFDESHDSWQKESNLKHSSILSQYKRSKGLK